MTIDTLDARARERGVCVWRLPSASGADLVAPCRSELHKSTIAGGQHLLSYERGVQSRRSEGVKFARKAVSIYADMLSESSMLSSPPSAFFCPNQFHEIACFVDKDRSSCSKSQPFSPPVHVPTEVHGPSPPWKDVTISSRRLAHASTAAAGCLRRSLPPAPFLLVWCLTVPSPFARASRRTSRYSGDHGAP